MPVLYQNGVSGVTNAILLVGGTSLSSTGLSSMQVVANPDTMHVVLDPEEVNGAREYVTVTTHNSSATTATITRAQQGSTAREHPSGTAWAHVAVDDDYSSIVADRLAADSVTTAKILDANITTAKIADDAITDAKLASAIGAQMVVFTTNGTFTKATYTNGRSARIRGVGGGGGGAGALAAGVNDVEVGDGGCSGTYFETIVPFSSLGTSETVTVGAAGAGGVGAADGTAGGNTSFGTHGSGNGGAGGTQNTSTASLKTYVNGDGSTPAGSVAGDGFTVPGSWGSAGPAGLTGSTGNAGHGGSGGNSPLGQGGDQTSSDAGNGRAGRGYGSGGGGGADHSEVSRTGGAGAPGIVIVEIFY